MEGLWQILDYCTEFINDIDDFDDIQLATDFFCYPNTREIFIAVLAPQNSLFDFMGNLLSRTEVKDISEFTWSLLHEVGHCQTYNKINQRTHHKCRHIKRKIDRGSIDPLTYYNLPDEYTATNWAINFVENNYEIVKEFDTQILKMLDYFYLINEVEID